MHTIGLLILSLLLILIIGNRSFLNMALSVSSWPPLLNTGGISADGLRNSSNSDDLGSRSSSVSRHIFTHLPFYNSHGNVSNDKVVMIGFDDAWKSQITYAKPILDKYGFKASFFVVCNYVNSGNIDRMNWQDLVTLQKDGMDIESHTMSHPISLDTLDQNQLEYQIGGSKQCLANHGYDSTIFAYPYNIGPNNPAVVGIVAKYYNIGRSGTAPLMFLNCNSFRNDPQTDCRTYGHDGRLNYANRYAARSLSFDIVEIKDSFNTTKIFSDFVKLVNSQSIYNTGGKIKVVPLLVFHNVERVTNHPYNTNVGLFGQLMKYLYENHFKVLTYKQLAYNTHTNAFYLDSSSYSSSMHK